MPEARSLLIDCVSRPQRQKATQANRKTPWQKSSSREHRSRGCIMLQDRSNSARCFAIVDPWNRGWEAQSIKRNGRGGSIPEIQRSEKSASVRIGARCVRTRSCTCVLWAAGSRIFRLCPSCGYSSYPGPEAADLPKCSSSLPTRR